MEVIKCPNCGVELDPNAKFCMECGMKVEKNVADTKLDVDMPELSETENTQKMESAIFQDSMEQDEEKTETPEDISQLGRQKKHNKRKKWSKKKIAITAIAVIIFFNFINFLLQPEIVSISATYEGATTAGTVIDNKNEGVIVTGVDADGNKHNITNWDIENPVVLEADSEQNVTINAKDLTCELLIECTTSAIESIYAEYTGSGEENIVLDNNNTDIEVYAIHKNESESQIEGGWKVVAPKTLTADETTKIEITYEDFSCELEVECTTRTIVDIEAKYDGETKEGTVIDKDDITVTAKYKNGSEEEITGWELSETPTLEAGKSVKVQIRYNEFETTLKVECSTMSEKQYKEKCKSISYDSLARNPDEHIGKSVKFKGRIVQVMEDDGAVALRINVTNDGYGYYDDTVYVIYFYEDGEAKFLEDDIVTFYGTYMGLYSYESVMGATITIPQVYASYIDLH